MTPTHNEVDFWRGPALALWFVFFGVGLVPGLVYVTLRHIGSVATQRALVNSPYFITVAFAVFVGIFCLRRCLSAGVPASPAHDKALQLGVCGLVAFMPFDFASVLETYSNPLVQPLYRWVVYGVGAVKVVTWCYLLSLFIRYYGLGSVNAFADVRVVFFSSRKARQSAKSSSSSRDSSDSEKSGVPATAEERTGETEADAS